MALSTPLSAPLRATLLTLAALLIIMLDLKEEASNLKLKRDRNTKSGLFHPNKAFIIRHFLVSLFILIALKTPLPLSQRLQREDCLRVRETVHSDQDRTRVA